MTWTKLGSEYGRNLGHKRLSDAAFRTHTEAIGYLYDVEAYDLRIPKHMVRTFALSDHYAEAIEELVAAGCWRDLGADYVVDHHGEVVRQSLAAQEAKRSRDLKAQHKRRGHLVSADADTDADTDNAAWPAATQTARQPSSRDEGTEVSATCIRCGKPSRRGCSTCWEHSGEEAS